MADVKLSAKDIGDLGEKIVTDLLPGAIHVNTHYDQHLNYDIIWNDLKLDVKTSISEYATIPFSLNFGTDKQGVIFVFVLVRDGEHYFWVERAHGKTKGYRRLHDASTAEELPDLIKKIGLTEDLPIEFEPRTKSIEISVEDYKDYDLERWMLEKEVGFPVTMANFIRKTVTFYKEHKDGDYITKQEG